VQSLLDGELPEGLEQERLSGPGRSADDEVLSGSRGTLLCPGPLRTDDVEIYINGCMSRPRLC
jgi:hypothetical protein